MLLGIKLSNLSRDQKNLKAQKIFFNQFCRVPKLQHSAKETLPRARPAHSAKFLLCRVPAGGTRQHVSFAECQKVALGKDLTPSAPLTGGAWRARVLGILPSAAGPALGKGDTLPSALLCRRPALGKARACRVPDFCRVPVAWHSANNIFAECP